MSSFRQTRRNASGRNRTERSPFPFNTDRIGMDHLQAIIRNVRRTNFNWLDDDESEDYSFEVDRHAEAPRNQPEPVPFEPAYRRDCTACTRGRMVCSFRAGGERLQPCSDCVRLNRRCELPAPRVRRSYGPPPGQEQKLPTLSESPPPPLRIPSSSATLVSGGGPRRSVSRVSRSPADEIIESSPEKKAQDPIDFVLSTRLAHPIQFDFRRLDYDIETACHWCESMAYGIRGLGVVQVSVLDCGDGEGFVELENGHTANGHLPSRMCSRCTKLRVSIVACKVHEMQEIPMMQGVDVDPKEPERYLELGLGESGLLEWCSVCPDVARYSCGKSISNGLEPKNLDDCGCGLRLCTDCMVKLVGSHDGNLTSFLTELFKDSQQGQHGTLGLRADVDFLHPEGELMRRVHHQLTHAKVTQAKSAYPKAARTSSPVDQQFETEGSNSGSNSESNSTSRKRRFESAFKYS